MPNNLASRQNVSDEYEELANIMRAHFSRPGPNQEEIDAFEKKGIDITRTDNLAEQIRAYCEWNCTTFPLKVIQLSPKLEAVLFYEYREYLQEDADVADILRVMGFKRPGKVQEGASLRLQKIESDFQMLQEQEHLIVPSITREEIQGRVMRAFGYVEELLEHLISFYSRWLTASSLNSETALGVMEEVPGVLEFGKAERKTWERWLHDEKKEKLLSGESLRIISHLNMLVSDEANSLSLLYQETFKSPPQNEFPIQQLSEDSVLIVPPEMIEKAKRQFSDQRHKYAHLRGREEIGTTDYLAEAVSTVGHIRDFVSYLVTQKIVPEVAIVRRRMTFGDGKIRLECWHEDEKLRPYRFPHFFRFYYHREKEVEIFFPWHILQRLNDLGSAVETDYLRLMMPVDFRQEDGIHLT